MLEQLQIRDAILALVRMSARPSVQELLIADSPEFYMTEYLTGKLAGVSILRKSDGNTAGVDFTSPAGNVLLRIERQGARAPSLAGEYAGKIGPFLLAIRIHEVDSLEWVYLPPEVRKSILEEAANCCQISAEELRRLGAVWLS